MTELGIINAAGGAVSNPLPQSWLGRIDAPIAPPRWISIGPMSARQIQLLQAQIGYDASGWNYNMVGTNNELGRYQITTQTLEDYGLLTPGSNVAYGTDCVNYLACWRPTYIKTVNNSYENYFYNTDSLRAFLTVTIAQDHLSYQMIDDYYNALLKIGAILSTDSADTVAGMIYVAWTLGVGTPPDSANSTGTGAYAWRYFAIGDGANSYNSGRYSLVSLS